jgi:thioredoxin
LILERVNDARSKRRAASDIRRSQKKTEPSFTEPFFELFHQDRSTPLVIDFFATWCGPCVLLASELEKVKAELGDSVRIVKVDTDEEAALSTQLQIQGLPTLVFVGTDTEKPALRTEGMLPAEMVKSIIANEL